MRDMRDRQTDSGHERSKIIQDIEQKNRPKKVDKKKSDEKCTKNRTKYLTRNQTS